MSNEAAVVEKEAEAEKRKENEEEKNEQQKEAAEEEGEKEEGEKEEENGGYKDHDAGANRGRNGFYNNNNFRNNNNTYDTKRYEHGRCAEIMNEETGAPIFSRNRVYTRFEVSAARCCSYLENNRFMCAERLDQGHKMCFKHHTAWLNSVSEKKEKTRLYWAARREREQREREEEEEMYRQAAEAAAEEEEAELAEAEEEEEQQNQSQQKITIMRQGDQYSSQQQQQRHQQGRVSYAAMHQNSLANTALDIARRYQEENTGAQHYQQQENTYQQQEENSQVEALRAEVEALRGEMEALRQIVAQHVSVQIPALWQHVQVLQAVVYKPPIPVIPASQQHYQQQQQQQQQHRGVSGHTI